MDYFENVALEENVSDLAIGRLTKDVRTAAALLRRDEARFLVDYYYQLQHDRIRAKNQVRDLSKAGEPNDVILWVSDNTATLEKRIGSALKLFAENDFVGKWAMSICGIGPVLAAGLSAHIDIEKAPNVGHLLSFAGMLPTAKPWLKSDEAKAMAKDTLGKAKVLTPDIIKRICERYRKSPEAMVQALMFRMPRHYNEAVEMLTGHPVDEDLIKYLTSRPFNAKLRVLFWKIGESFIKVSGKESDVYGKVYVSSKAIYEAKNDAGDYADQAAQILSEKRWNKGTDAYAALSAGRLPQAQIHARARRKAINLFVSHWWEVAYRHRFPERECPKPYVLDVLGKTEYIEIPNDPF